jgi:AcrR family transcriptional regulator
MEQTVAAAHALFAERGYAAVTMDGVAAAVGVTKPLLYNYFGNKEQLYLACLERAGDGLMATVVEAVGDTTNPTEALSLGLHAFFDFVDQDRAAWSVLFDETLPNWRIQTNRMNRIISTVAFSWLAFHLARRADTTQARSRLPVTSIAGGSGLRFMTPPPRA